MQGGLRTASRTRQRLRACAPHSRGRHHRRGVSAGDDQKRRQWRRAPAQLRSPLHQSPACAVPKLCRGRQCRHRSRSFSWHLPSAVPHVTMACGGRSEKPERRQQRFGPNNSWIGDQCAGAVTGSKSVRPPSTVMIWPVMNPEPSEARNWTASATSLGFPMRFRGVWSLMSSR